MVYETHESRKITEIADAINDIMQSGETAQKDDGVANIPPKYAEHTPPNAKPPQAKVEAKAMPAIDEAHIEGQDSNEGTENNGTQDMDETIHDESPHDSIANQAAVGDYGGSENTAQNIAQNIGQDDNADMDAGLEAAIAAEIASDPIAQQTVNNEPNNNHEAENGNAPHNYETQEHTQADWSQQIDPEINAGETGAGEISPRHAVGALWETGETGETEATEEATPPLSFAQTTTSETPTAPKPAKDNTDLHTLSLRMRDTLADLKNENPAQHATQKLFEQMKQARDAMFVEMRKSIADFTERAGAQQASIAQAVDQMNQEMADIRAELEMMVVRYHEQNGDIHKAYTEHFANERQRIGRYREFLQFLLRERGT